ncbi:MAG: hypothetical protein IM580_08235 [Pseudanabaena sp. M090S1SP2A07QC]|nr:hypothetical protein [Pseudanabaena sp. M090S1SP2A07QC]MCA6510235.1 hypothetical protein [Pseudanabaena sp. M109S1SP2A07QC]
MFIRKDLQSRRLNIQIERILLLCVRTRAVAVRSLTSLKPKVSASDRTATKAHRTTELFTDLPVYAQDRRSLRRQKQMMLRVYAIGQNAICLMGKCPQTPRSHID